MPTIVTTLFLVRHGEKDESPTADPNDPRLSQMGAVRAQTLARMLGQSGIGVIYTSTFIRTKLTAQPLASQLHITPVVLTDAADIKSDIRSHHLGGKILVVGHTNTVPDLINLIGGGTFKMKENEFDKMYVATIVSPNTTSVVEMRYGNPNPPSPSS